MMKGVFLFTARTRGRPRAPRSNRAAITLLPVALLLQFVLLTPVCAQDARAPALLAKSPAEMGVMYNEFDTIATVIPKIHTGLGWFTAELGDLNGDGFDDYAVTSSLDTTFLFYGGVPLPVEPRYFVLGGSGGVAAGDFNGDGYVDLATTVRANNVTGNPDPERRGFIRVYYNTRSDPPFRGSDPDQILRAPEGKVELWGTPLAGGDVWYPGIKVCDFNGDGVPDLLTHATRKDSTLVSNGYKFYQVFFGGDSLPTTPNLEIRPPVRGDGISHNYDYRYHVGDLNGDGCTDIMIRSLYYDNHPQGAHSPLDVYLGNSAGRVEAPSFSMEYGFWKQNDRFGVADLNNDGCDEVIGAYSVTYGNAPYCQGRPDISSIQADDSLRNPLPSVLVGSQMVCPVGDVNGDGTRDVLVSWVPELFRMTSVYFLYANRSGAVNKTAYGSFGVDLDLDNLEWGAWPVGDVNGDGYDDVILLGLPSDTPGNRSIRFRIYGGNSKLVTVADIPRLPESMRLSAYPNPVHAGQSVQLLLHSDAALSGDVLLFDALGRELRRMSVNVEARSNSWPLALDGLLPGMYSIVFRSATRTSHTSLLVL
ncbi:MAG: T9SS type A sorting domain-containing protein [Bacteroidia bacterium]|nr:T9SS type A sorting domain-containing protein [Bacteroidia bacterium]